MGSLLSLFVFFFLIETKDRTLEEIDTMYVRGVNPIKSASWSSAGYRKEVPRDSIAATSVTADEQS